MTRRCSFGNSGFLLSSSMWATQSSSQSRRPRCTPMESILWGRHLTTKYFFFGTKIKYFRSIAMMPRVAVFGWIRRRSLQGTWALGMLLGWLFRQMDSLWSAGIMMEGCSSLIGRVLRLSRSWTRIIRSALGSTGTLMSKAPVWPAPGTGLSNFGPPNQKILKFVIIVILIPPEFSF